MNFLKRQSAYIIGAGLSYIGAFGVNYNVWESNSDVRIVWALVFGTLTWPFLLVPQIFVQWLTRKLIGHRFDKSLSKELFILNFPIAILVTALLASHYMTSNPKSAFEYLVVKPIPASVVSVEQGGSRAMDSVFRVLHFKISKPDLRKLLDGQHFVQINEEDFDRQFWEQRIRDTVKLNVNFTKDWQAFTLKENGGQKYIFSNTTSTETVFVADAH